MDGLDEAGRQVEDLVAGPASVLLLLLAEQAGLGAAALAQPVVAFDLACDVGDALRPWSEPHQLDVAAWVLRRAEEVRPLAEAVVAEEGAAWWWGPWDRWADEVVTWSADPRPAGGRDTAADDRWSAYAQKPASVLFSGTARAGASHLAVAVTRGMGDYVPADGLGRLALPERELDVLELRGPHDWHALATGAPVRFEGDPLREPVVNPAWSEVAPRADGVHLTFGGWLTSWWRRVESDAGVTMLWAWDNEQTAWLAPDVGVRDVRRWDSEAADHGPRIDVSARALGLPTGGVPLRRASVDEDDPPPPR